MKLSQEWDRALQITKGSPVAVLLGWKLPLASHLRKFGTGVRMLRCLLVIYSWD